MMNRFILVRMKTAVAYLRKSHVQDAAHEVSYEMQEAAVRQLASQHGDNELLILSDWNKSGMGHKTHLRTSFKQLLEMLDRDEVSAVYSYSLSRLGRSVPVVSSLIETCSAKAVPVRLAKDSIDTSTATGRMMANMLVIVAAFEAEVASERTKDAMAVRMARGGRIGIAPYGEQPGESVQAVIDAFDRAGSCFGAARLLNEAGSRTRRGALWSSKVVGDVLRRAGVAYAHRKRPGAKAKADWIAFQLLTCPCGQRMTAMDRRKPRVTCYKSRHDPEHPKPFSITEAAILPALKAEAALLRVPETVEMPADDLAARDALRAKRERVLDMFADGLIDKPERARRLAEIDDAMEALDASREVVALPPEIDWGWPPERVNAVLRALWERVELGPDLMPARFVWRVPEWRAEAA